MDQEIIEQIKLLFEGTDERNWEKVKRTMNDIVLLDYSSFNKNPAASLTSTDIVNSWASFLPGFDRTHHELADFSVAVHGKSAMVHYTGHAEHFINEEIWIVEGTYDTKLILVNGKWLIAAHKLNFIHQSGNANLPALALQKMDGGRQ